MVSLVQLRVWVMQYVQGSVCRPTSDLLVMAAVLPLTGVPAERCELFSRSTRISGSSCRASANACFLPALNVFWDTPVVIRTSAHCQASVSRNENHRFVLQESPEHAECSKKREQFHPFILSTISNAPQETTSCIQLVPYSAR